MCALFAVPCLFPPCIMHRLGSVPALPPLPTVPIGHRLPTAQAVGRKYMVYMVPGGQPPDPQQR
jgi:hypothetical protein